MDMKKKEKQKEKTLDDPEIRKHFEDLWAEVRKNRPFKGMTRQQILDWVHGVN